MNQRDIENIRLVSMRSFLFVSMLFFSGVLSAQMGFYSGVSRMGENPKRNESIFALKSTYDYRFVHDYFFAGINFRHKKRFWFAEISSTQKYRVPFEHITSVSKWGGSSPSYSWSHSYSAFCDYSYVGVKFGLTFDLIKNPLKKDDWEFHLSLGPSVRLDFLQKNKSYGHVYEYKWGSNNNAQQQWESGSEFSYEPFPTFTHPNPVFHLGPKIASMIQWKRFCLEINHFFGIQPSSHTGKIAKISDKNRWFFSETSLSIGYQLPGAKNGN